MLVVPPERAGIVFELDQVQPAAPEHEQIDLVPAAVAVAELEVGPGAERRLVRQQAPDDVEARLVGELRL